MPRGFQMALPLPFPLSRAQSPGAEVYSPRPGSQADRSCFATGRVSTCAVGPAVAGSPRNFLEMQILGPRPHMLNQTGVSSAVFTKPTRGLWCHSSLRITATASWNLGCSNPCKFKHFPWLCNSDIKQNLMTLYTWKLFKNTCVKKTNKKTSTGHP